MCFTSWCLLHGFYHEATLRHIGNIRRQQQQDHWNNWSNWVVAANNIIAFKIRLDKHMGKHQDIIYDFRVQIDRTGSRSEVLRVNVVYMIS